ncbi:MAG: hypothetical protein MPK62_01110 [Alphaproteobacteria bacterium]|nr:hypothetical protein [Nitrosopumilus sp.]MDA8008212.1 hypothetical protein [Alphaproteobacteria bacterium]MDA8029734.1 hypothetical protein [Alphaproteobacteria bacterium]
MSVNRTYPRAKNHRRISIIGVSGAGKRTLAAILADTFEKHMIRSGNTYKNGAEHVMGRLVEGRFPSATQGMSLVGGPDSQCDVPRYLREYVPWIRVSGISDKGVPMSYEVRSYDADGPDTYAPVIKADKYVVVIPYGDRSGMPHLERLLHQLDVKKEGARAALVVTKADLAPMTESMHDVCLRYMDLVSGFFKEDMFTSTHSYVRTGGDGNIDTPLVYNAADYRWLMMFMGELWADGKWRMVEPWH